MEKWLVFLLDTNIWLECQRGDALYESEIRSQVKAGNDGKIVAIC